MDYAIIRVGGKQYRVSEGQTLVVDRLKTDEGKTFTPDVLLGDAGATVTAKVLTHERGPKIRIGKYKKRTGYKRHNGFRSAISRIQIESIGTGKAAPAKKAAAPKAEKAAPKVEAVAVEAVVVEAVVAEASGALPDDDVAGHRCLAVEHLHAQELRVRVAAVLRGAEAFLVCH